MQAIPVVIDILIGVGMVGGVIAALVKLGRRFDALVRGLAGEPERLGVPRRPGVLERLDEIEGQLRPNTGHSMRDAIDRVEDSLRTHREEAERRFSELRHEAQEAQVASKVQVVEHIRTHHRGDNDQIPGRAMAPDTRE